jgi:hypothetical protein
MTYYKIISKDKSSLWKYYRGHTFPTVRYEVGKIVSATNLDGELYCQRPTAIHFCDNTLDTNEWVKQYCYNCVEDEDLGRLYDVVRFIKVKPIGRVVKTKHNGWGPRGPDECYARKIKVLSEISHEAFAKLVVRDVQKKKEQYLDIHWLYNVPRGVFENKKFHWVYAAGVQTIEQGAFRGTTIEGLMLTGAGGSKKLGMQKLLPGQLSGLCVRSLYLPEVVTIEPGAFDDVKIEELNLGRHRKVSISDTNRNGLKPESDSDKPVSSTPNHYDFVRALTERQY